MKAIKRYNAFNIGENKNGRYVKHSDHIAQRAKDKQAVMALFAKYGKGLFSSKQLNCAIKISEGLDKIYKEV